MDKGTPPEIALGLNKKPPKLRFWTVVNVYYVRAISPHTLGGAGVTYFGFPVAVISGRNTQSGGVRALAHEMGHVLGLDEQGFFEFGSLMNPNRTGGTTLSFCDCVEARRSPLGYF